MNYLDQIAKRLNVRITDKNLAECLDSCIDSVDLSNPDEIVIQTYKKKSAIKIKNGKFDLYGEEEDEEILRKFSGLFISFLGWDNSAFPIEQSKLISYHGRVPEHNVTTDHKSESTFSKNDEPAFTIKAAPPHKGEDSSTSSGTSPKDAFSHSASTQQEQLQKRADVWKSRGLEKVDIHDESVWVSVKENVVIEDRGEELKLYGDYDLQAISLMVSHAKETWNNNCYVDGDDKFKTLVWRECYLQGVKLQNFEPEPKDKERIVSAIRRSQAGKGQGIGPQPIAA